MGSVALVTACLLLGGMGTRVRADAPSTSAADTKAYDAEVEAGVRAYERHDWTAAQFHFEHAHHLRPSARSLRALGLTVRQAGRNAEAAALCARALRSPDLPLTHAMQAELRATHASLDRLIARYRLVLEDPGATLRVDGKVGLFDAGELLLDPGKHELIIEASLAAPIARRVEARPGERAELRVSRTARPDDGESPAPADASREPELQTQASVRPLPVPERRAAGWSTRDHVAFGAVVGGAAAFVLGATFGVLALVEDDASRDDCSLDECGADGLEHRNTAFAHARVATIGFVAAGVLIATGLTLHLTGDEEAVPRGQGPRAGLALDLAVSTERASLALGGRWH